jgi:protein involved in polysaccharide export with SLBB domain
MRVADLISQNHQLIQTDYFRRRNALVQSDKSQEILSEFKNILDEVNWDYAVVERLNANTLRPQLIPFNLGKAVHDKDPAHNLFLEPGDVVTVFGLKDLPGPLEKRTQFVRLVGEVKVPGLYQLQAKETLPALIQRAGGLTGGAYAYGTQLTRESMRQLQQENLDRAVRKMEAGLSGQFSAQAQNSSEADKNSVQAQMAMQKSMLDRLKQLKASGRIALEMAPDAADYPTLTLEDGDNITVPHRSDFVAVFGAVMLETSLIHRQGQTVAECLDKAGAMREADLDGALLIKADGTVVANRAMRSWAGWGNASFMNTRVYPGDAIFVPELVDRRTPYTQFIQGAKDWTQLLYQFGLGAVAIKTLRN